MNTALLKPLATAALIGTDRQPPAWPQVPGAVGGVLEQLESLSVERRLLTAAGVLAVSGLAGHLTTKGGGVLPSAASESARVVNEPRFVSVCAQILADGPERLQTELMLQLARAGGVLPPRLLPAALRAGRRNPHLRPALLPVLGQRGGWLARQNVEWSFALGAEADELDERLWHEGVLEARVRFLAALRQRDTGRARELLAATLPNESARDRAALVAVVVSGLAPDDEAFLQSCLADRSKEVRATAARLLSRLPESAFARRMVARLDPLLKSERKLLRSVLTLEAPSAFATDWAADALEETRPAGESLGDRAWWLFQIARLTPLNWWQQRTGRNPTDLLQWALDSDWKLALLRGWLGAQAEQQRQDWALAWLELPQINGLDVDPFTLLEPLPPATRERHWLKFLESQSRQAGYGSLLHRISQTLPLDAPPLSAEFCRRVLKLVRDAVNNGSARGDYALRPALTDFACWFPPALLPEAAADWKISGEETQSYTEAIARFFAIIEQRQTLHAALAAPA